MLDDYQHFIKKMTSVFENFGVYYFLYYILSLLPTTTCWRGLLSPSNNF